MAAFERASGTGTRYDGNDLREWFSHATRLFETNAQLINALNVFPVPDGDTGTNMLLTLRDVVKESEATQSTSAGDMASAMARAAMMAARGNSGIILSQFFKGIAVVMEGAQDFGATELASAFESAREHAYKAVGEPVVIIVDAIGAVVAGGRVPFAAGDWDAIVHTDVAGPGRESHEDIRAIGRPPGRGGEGALGALVEHRLRHHR